MWLRSLHWKTITKISYIYFYTVIFAEFETITSFSLAECAPLVAIRCPRVFWNLLEHPRLSAGLDFPILTFSTFSGLGSAAQCPIYRGSQILRVHNLIFGRAWEISGRDRSVRRAVRVFGKICSWAPVSDVPIGAGNRLFGIWPGRTIFYRENVDLGGWGLRTGARSRRWLARDRFTYPQGCPGESVNFLFGAERKWENMFFYLVRAPSM